MDLTTAIKFTGQPLILYGENQKENEIRLSNLAKIVFVFFSKKKFSVFNRKNPPQTLKLNFGYFFHYRSKIEMRKMAYQKIKKIRELFLSFQGIKDCLSYNNKKSSNQKYRFYLKKKTTKVFRSLNYELISKHQGSFNLFSFQSGESCIFFSNSSGKIFLNDLNRKKITFEFSSGLLGIQLLSSHPCFLKDLLVSNTECSEFFKLSFLRNKTLLHYIYHKDFINFQKYRKNNGLIDFGTISMKWKGFDQIAQKYVFSRQLGENILDVSMYNNENLFLIKTPKNFLLFDERINKKIGISNLNYKSKKFRGNLSTKYLPSQFDKTEDFYKFFGAESFFEKRNLEKVISFDSIPNFISKKSMGNLYNFLSRYPEISPQPFQIEIPTRSFCFSITKKLLVIKKLLGFGIYKIR